MKKLKVELALREEESGWKILLCVEEEDAIASDLRSNSSVRKGAGVGQGALTSN
jgi:hypothetical protein